MKRFSKEWGFRSSVGIQIFSKKHLESVTQYFFFFTEQPNVTEWDAESKESTIVRMINNNQFASTAQFCLCCLVHAARQSLYPENESFTMNYANSDPVIKNILPPIKLIQKGAPNEIKLPAVGCAVNRKKDDEIDFYVRADAQDSNATYVFDLKNDPERKALIISEHVSGIPLPDRDAIYYVKPVS